MNKGTRAAEEVFERDNLDANALVSDEKVILAFQQLFMVF
jgi:hypothetical protein